MSDRPLRKEDLDLYLKELAKEFRKRNGKAMPAEITLIGGAAILINYGFREMTYDMDAIMSAASSIRDAISFVGDKYGLPVGWINDDFTKTDSYTPRIIRFSKYYRTYSNIMTVRTVTGEYLIAMKLKSGRQYKYDRSDIIGILWEQKKAGAPLSFEMIKKAVEDLYDSYDVLSDDMKRFIERAMQEERYEEMYNRIRQAEIENRDTLLEYQDRKPGVVNTDNADNIIAALMNKKASSDHV
ncbi:MAG: hypothetical protein IJJ23_12325 [Clostridia bacterium]|nr:hypothetical protein [Clostridia bacterium]